MFGNPFRPLTLSPVWRTPTILALAQAAHDTLAALYPKFRPMFDAALAADLNPIAAGPKFTGTLIGRAAALLMLSVRSGDGANAAMT